MERKTPILVTLTAPTCAGKSYLFNYIRDVAKLPCLISTTTRAPRQGEVEGVDYFFISEEESLALERSNQFAELAIYRGIRYGVTKQEFYSKLNEGIAFLIVEPSGIDHYVKPATDAGALHMKYYVHTDFDLRFMRFKNRAIADIEDAALVDENLSRMGKPTTQIKKTVNSYMDRLVAMTTVENKWGDMANWERMLSGKHLPEYNLQIILNDVEDKRAHLADCNKQILS